MFYTPARVFCIDESLIPFRGRLIFKQYIPNKAHTYGVKIFKLCAGPGCTWNMKIYSGKEADQNNSILTKIVLELSEKLLDTGRMAVTDNYYTSIDLANQLLQRRTHLMGTLRANRRGNPKEVVGAKLKKGEIKAKQVEHGISILKWKDKRDVLMLSTYHFNETLTIQIRGKEIVKPLMVVDYNKGKSSVDLSDQFASYGSCVRKTVKWYHKIAIKIILGTAIVNSHLLYEEVTGNKISLLDFREAIIDKLLDRPLTDPDVKKKTHAFEKHPGNSRVGRRYCRGCYKKKLKNEIPKNKVKKLPLFVKLVQINLDTVWNVLIRAIINRNFLPFFL
ncbi:unnamed protein product [Acanthoscelides obtectus]|uniref:PiggyBac transposable element-derived protein domain-containing protein n=1 Tax=Acanthoscelides obtectus TaxID=200917 RepID=A0A9P0K0Y3_ACAOB|nr:unnamed protein product [Acanthoscelides obtectus]CAK1663999.1 PiggyBac transposable element-derived protein 4 [Acanthoscelides obtectus]